MVKENIIPIENKKPFETVYEIKNETQSVVGDQIPSFEEFMKDYKVDENLNYDDLTHGDDIGEANGYGPCSSSSCPQISSCQFRLEISVVNEGFFSDFRKRYSLKSYGDARDFLYNKLYRSGTTENNNFSTLIKNSLGYHVSLAMAKHKEDSRNVNGWITVKESPGFLGWGEAGGASISCDSNY